MREAFSLEKLDSVLTLLPLSSSQNKTQSTMCNQAMNMSRCKALKGNDTNMQPSGKALVKLSCCPEDGTQCGKEVSGMHQVRWQEEGNQPTEKIICFLVLCKDMREVHIESLFLTI